MKRVILFLFLISQISKEANCQYWFIGDNYVIRFGKDLVDIDTMFGIKNLDIVKERNLSVESTGVAIDDKGELIFYTNGEKVFNKKNELIVNGDGLLGHFSASNLLIVPKPKSTNEWYIITADLMVD